MQEFHTKAKLDKSIIFKGGLFTLTIIKLQDLEFARFGRELKANIAKAPNFFYNAPIVIDLKCLHDSLIVDFERLQEIIRQCRLVPVGIVNASKGLEEQAIAAGLAVLRSPTEPQVAESEQSKSIKKTKSLTIDTPIRSGQQIYAREGDLIINAAVSNGAEILADGNIHVYGTLRGRAIAGVASDTSARIFCTSLEAELVSIAGHYIISEDIQAEFWKQAVEISVSNDNLHIRKL